MTLVDLFIVDEGLSIWNYNWGPCIVDILPFMNQKSYGTGQVLVNHKTGWLDPAVGSGWAMECFLEFERKMCRNNLQYLMVKSMVSRNSFWKSLNSLKSLLLTGCKSVNAYTAYTAYTCLILFVGQKTMEPIGTIWFGRWTSIIHCVLVRKNATGYWCCQRFHPSLRKSMPHLKYLGIWNPWTHPARLISEWGWIPISPVGDEHQGKVWPFDRLTHQSWWK